MGLNTDTYANKVFVLTICLWFGQGGVVAVKPLKEWLVVLVSGKKVFRLPVLGCVAFAKTWVFHLLQFPPVRYPLAICSRTWAIRMVSRMGKSVTSLPYWWGRSSRNDGKGKVHS